MSELKIHVQFDADDGDFALMCESYQRTMPAGPRLFRAPPWPAIRFRGHETMESAEKDARLLRSYLGALKKGPSKSEARKEGA